MRTEDEAGDMEKLEGVVVGEDDGPCEIDPWSQVRRGWWPGPGIAWRSRLGCERRRSDRRSPLVRVGRQGGGGVGLVEESQRFGGAQAGFLQRRGVSSWREILQWLCFFLSTRESDFVGQAWKRSWTSRGVGEGLLILSRSMQRMTNLMSPLSAILTRVALLYWPPLIFTAMSLRVGFQRRIQRAAFFAEYSRVGRIRIELKRLVLYRVR